MDFHVKKRTTKGTKDKEFFFNNSRRPFWLECSFILHFYMLNFLRTMFFNIFNFKQKIF